MTAFEPAFQPVPAEQLAALLREDCTAVYNVMKLHGLADPEAYSGPELRCASSRIIRCRSWVMP